jgi:hypothetical protein
VSVRRSSGRLLPLTLAALVGAVVSAGCEDECVTVSTACDPLYAPTFDEVHARTLVTSCATAGAACHGAEGGRGGLVLSDREGAYGALVEAGRVVSGDPGCSELVARLVSTDPDVQMPPGAPLSDAERCAIVQWIADGAAR